jgi:hypothetical protein
MRLATGRQRADGVKMAGTLLAIFFAGGVLGCAGLPEQVRHYGALATPIELPDTPFFPQEQYQCGPAALMTVLSQSGARVSMEALVEQVYLPARHGSLQAELMAAARREGRIPYLLDPGMAAIAEELVAGRPVLVLQNLGVSWYPQWHYAVVVGVDPLADEVVLRSGTQMRRMTSGRTFLYTWRRSGYWGLVTLRPGELPAAVQRERYLDAVAAMESTGEMAAARAGWQAALARWPGDRIALFGLANSQLALGEPARAEVLYLELLATDPQNLAARNNLAHALARQGKREQALDELQRALRDVGDDSVMRAELEDSLRQVRGD